MNTLKIVVCVRQGTDGMLNPFDACAFEEALRIPNAEIILLSMAPVSAKDFLLSLTRLGANQAILLSDRAFAGADTLATAYTLSLAIRKIRPDLVFCGRQTLIGDTAQTGAMLSVLIDFSLIINVMQILSLTDTGIVCWTRTEGSVEKTLPALITVERINTLRLPGLRSKTGELTVWDAEALGADLSRCGFAGSPTRVLQTFENKFGKRRCRWIQREELKQIVAEGIERAKEATTPSLSVAADLKNVVIVGEAPRAFAQSVSNDITVFLLTDAADLAEKIQKKKPSAVIFGSDAVSKRVSAQVAAMLQLGLCADCTSLANEGGTLTMYRPALSGSLIAKIKSTRTPAMATVRTEEKIGTDVIIGAGYGVKNQLKKIKALATEYHASVAVTKKLVDHGYAAYEDQVGLTGKTISVPVYLAIGISGAVHHIAGMGRSGTVIAINPDRQAPIFDYADYGIAEEF